ncbi:helix-turn-helix transcriptional regulator (plasmid) [Paracoccus sp. TK19116]|uniref:Helix-turn-helix transcriptional regulator n=1 Tax=Paracoccus albicereus TaxID=2922394 RepID=A0ABT1ML13_9RHOB|nr:helix-turn-helix domain-containing protein [Paracoccus albicereus]MCQ0968972.1 helix-turn-helix transcriptional regulator [Paracoccus albicereus]
MTDSGKKLRYDEGCLGAHALNLVGDRWALLVVRELMFAPKRFQMIRAGLPGITATVLTGRLAQLQEAGVVSHDPRLGVYALTEAGTGLLPVLQSLCRWALTVPGHDHRRFISPSALMISMGVCLRTDLAQHAGGPAGFDLGQEMFEMRVEDGRTQTVAVARPDTPFVLSGDGNRMAVAVYGSAPVAALAAKGMIGATGDLQAAQAFVDQFRLAPQPSVMA